MMYHFMLGLRGCSAAAAPSIGGACTVDSFLVSSAIIIPADTPAGTSTFLSDQLQQVAQSEFDHLIDHFKISRKDEDSNNYDGGRRLNFLASGVVDLLHLRTHFLEEIFRAIWPGL